MLVETIRRTLKHTEALDLTSYFNEVLNAGISALSGPVMLR
jgi:hypothetical protein